jgi:hypothetical protein
MAPQPRYFAHTYLPFQNDLNNELSLNKVPSFPPEIQKTRPPNLGQKSHEVLRQTGFEAAFFAQRRGRGSGPEAQSPAWCGALAGSQQG